MKCVFCKIEMENKEIGYEEYGVFLGKFPAMVCPNCGESFFDLEIAKKIQAKSKEKGLFGLSKKVKVGKVGDSLMVRIPKEIAKFVKLQEGKEVSINPPKNKIIIDI